MSTLKEYLHFRLLLYVILFTSFYSSSFSESITNSLHNLSNSGPGVIKASTESRICIFCHAPHRTSGQAPLWNREDSRETYIVYDSPTLSATIDQPDGSSRLCLSCHDGTIALGNISSEVDQIQFQNGVVFLPPGHSLISTDLSNDHPISFTYDNLLSNSNVGLVDPSLLPPQLPLDHDNKLQCSTCHDPHSNIYGDFLRMSPLYSQLCIVCHTKSGWAESAHNNSSSTWDGNGIDPWPNTNGITVAENGCQNCHQLHASGEPKHLLGYAQEENNCLVCHNGNIGSDIVSTLTLFSSHPVADYSNIHEVSESPNTMPRHVECSDCHNPHATKESLPGSTLPGALNMISGVDINGTIVDPILNSYEVCLKCHGDNHGVIPVITRVVNSMNIRQDINPTSLSFHPVAAPGRNNYVPSLIPPLDESSLITCMDCHSSSDGTTAGPHGSEFSPILKLNYSTTDNTSESNQAYALCYSCHDRASILNDESFEKHEKHIVGEDAPCSACHDSHGVPSMLNGTGSHLINFDLSIVSPDPSTGRLEFIDFGERAGECYLNCHNEEHSPEDYRTKNIMRQN